MFASMTRASRMALMAVAASAWSWSASAADLPLKAAPSRVVAATWTGPYVGIGLGARVMDPDWTTTAAFAPFIGTSIPFSTDPNASLSSTAFRVSGYAGYNWQIAPQWVTGVEVDVGWARNKDTVARIPGLGVVGGGSFAEVKGTWDGSLRARIGYLVTPTMLAYATGGGALQHIEAIATCPADTTVCNPAVGTQSFSNSQDRIGWTVGAGLEAMLAGHWMARVEYRYADYGSFSFTAIPFTLSTFGASASLSTVTHTIYGGLAYKF